MRVFSMIAATLLGLLTLAACGSGGSGGGAATPETALAATRTGTDISTAPLINVGGTTRALTFFAGGSTPLFSGIDAVVSLPPGVTVKADPGGSVSAAVLHPSGGAVGNAIAAGNYTPPSATMPGRVRVALVSARGFPPGEFMTLHCDVAPDATPVDADFGLSLLSAIDAKGGSLADVSLNARSGQ